jgi:hypothetical protein
MSSKFQRGYSALYTSKKLMVCTNIFTYEETHRYLHQFAVFFDKNLVKYIFGIFEYSSFGILHLRIIILDSRMGVFSTKYIGNLIRKNNLERYARHI